MLDENRLADITRALLEFDPIVPLDSLFPTVVPEAAPLIASDPYAFLIAVCLDRGTKAEIIWTIPYDMKNKLGHLEPHRIHAMSLDALAELFGELPRRPRYVNDAPRTVHDLTRIVVEEFEGDTSRIWVGRRAADVHRTLRSIHGVGPGIASMGVLLIEKGIWCTFRRSGSYQYGYQAGCSYRAGPVSAGCERGSDRLGCDRSLTSDEPLLPRCIGWRSLGDRPPLVFCVQPELYGVPDE